MTTDLHTATQRSEAALAGLVADGILTIVDEAEGAPTWEATDDSMEAWLAIEDVPQTEWDEEDEWERECPFDTIAEMRGER